MSRPRKITILMAGVLCIAAVALGAAYFGGLPTRTVSTQGSGEPSISPTPEPSPSPSPEPPASPLPPPSPEAEVSKAPAPKPDFEFSCGPTDYNKKGPVPPGGSEDASCRVRSLNNFSGTVTLSCSNPYGWKCAGDKPPLTISSGGSDSSVVFVEVPQGTADGDYRITFIATSGSLSHSDPYLIAVRSSGGGCGGGCPTSED